MPTPSGGTAKKATSAKRAPRARRRAVDRSVVTGASSAWINGADGVTQEYWEGDAVPECTDEELDRLEALGVFGDHPRVEAKRLLDELVAAGLASVGMSEVERAAEEQSAKADTSDEDDGSGEPVEPLAPPILPEQAPAPSTHGVQPATGK